MPFTKGRSGNPTGRPKGAKDSIPRTFRGLARKVVSENPDAIERALLNGCKGKDAHKYLGILAGLERQQVEVTGEGGGPVVYKWQE